MHVVSEVHDASEKRVMIDDSSFEDAMSFLVLMNYISCGNDPWVSMFFVNLCL